ncbi:hypothetical protein [Sphingomonas daechungensis]|uniref:hypothetical protein n=1 Tax=Sphingomonas daechungensis TaxID=1176646 RepID=UPI00378460FB
MITFLGAKRRVCEERRSGYIIRTIKALYVADLDAQAYLTLITRPERLRQDMATFQSTAATFRTCKTIWSEPKGRFSIGQGAACPKEARWF